MPALLRRPVPLARPPWQLAPRLAGSGVHALDAGGPEGWRSAPGGDGAASLLCVAPEAVFAGGLEALDEARRWLCDWRGPHAEAGLLVGTLGYELGRAFEDLPARAAPQPVDAAPPVRLAAFRAAYRYAPDGRGEVLGSDPEAVAELHERVRAAAAEPAPPGAPRRLPAPRPRTSDAAYCAAIARIQAWIRAGDVYQVNLSRRLDLAPLAPGELPLLYGALCERSPAPFAAYLELGRWTVLSNSPERFLRVEGARVETCPIKGTRPRSPDPERDRALAKELLASAKDRAEHVMIVDLERNDLGRVCRPPSVRVARLAELRSYNVHHLVSSVRGELRDPLDWPGLLAATFPGGSITGAPKLRAMQIIDALEPVRRGVYTGALGCFDAAGGIDLAIAIRSAVHHGQALHLHLGGGIVADSDPLAELAETGDKGDAFAALWRPA